MRNAGTLLICLVAAPAALAGCDDDDDNERPAPDAALPGDAAPDSPGVAVQCAADNGGITLPAGFCATVFADGAGKIRQIAVSPAGRVYVDVAASAPGATDAHVLGLFDANNDGVAEQKETFGDLGGNGIAWNNGQLYVAANDRVVRYEMSNSALVPTASAPTVIASGWPATGDHTAKTVVISGTTMYINVGSPSNACQEDNRALHSPGKDPCDELATRAGVWQLSTTAANQSQAAATRVGTGLRNTNAMALEPTTNALWGAINGRDQLHENWPELFTEEQDKQLPAEEVFKITPGLDRGWPYCYYDAGVKQMKLAPEYGGDGTMQGRCATIAAPPLSLPAHAAPLAMVFATGTQFPAAYRSGAFISNHGSRFDENATDLHGYDVEFAPFQNGEPSGTVEKFATGFDAGQRPLPDAAPHRPMGLAMMPDGSLLIGDDKGGRIWRVYYKGN